jgi:hypothetical protein
MKKHNLIRLLFLSCVLFSCQPKKEKKQPEVNYTIQNYKLDDDPVTNKKTEDSKDKRDTITLRK